VIPVAEIRITEGYYEEVTCDENKINEYIEEESFRKRLKDHCKTRGRDIEVLKFIVQKDKNGNIVRVWSIEAYYGPFGVLIFLDNP
jgi:hypothetical protein